MRIALRFRFSGVELRAASKSASISFCFSTFPCTVPLLSDTSVSVSTRLPASSIQPFSAKRSVCDA